MNIIELLFVFTSVFITILISAQRKNLLKHYDFYILIIFDALMTGLFMILAALYFGSHNKIVKQVNSLTSNHVLIIILISFLITLNSILGLKLLESYSLGDLVITTTVVEIFVAMIFDYLYYGKSFTFNKLVSIPVLILGLYIFTMK